MMGKVRKASKQKFRTPEGFRYASQRPEAFGKGIEYKPEGGYDPVKRRDTIAPRNVGTAKGRSRNETITGQPMVTYSTDPFAATDIQLKKEQDHHKELCAKIGSARPYSSATCANRAFGKVENEPETDKPLYAKDNTRPWTRSGPFRRAVKGGEMFCPVPDLRREPRDDVARRRAALPLRRQPSPSRRGTCRRPSRSGRPSGRRTRSPRRARRACCLSPGPRGAVLPGAKPRRSSSRRSPSSRSVTVLGPFARPDAATVGALYHPPPTLSNARSACTIRRPWTAAARTGPRRPLTIATPHSR